MAKRPELEGRVVASHGRHYIVEFADGTTRKCFSRGKKAEAAVGDRVLVQAQGKEEGVIEGILPRRNLLFRSDDTRSKQFAANVDQLLIVIAPEPMFSMDLLGRALVAARSADIEPIILLNKADLTHLVADARERLDAVRGSGVPIIEGSALAPDSLKATLLPLLKDKCTLLLGQSAMGKSTILNALVPDAEAPTQSHSLALGAGRHTTTTTRLYHLPNGNGDLIDSPGFQAFGLMHLSPEEIQHGFPEFAPFVETCRFYNCSHRHEPGCGVLAALERGDIAPQRHQLYVRLLDENEAQVRY